MDVFLNWLWQGGVVAIAAVGMLRLLDRSKAAVRCVVCWAALLLVAILPAVAYVAAGLSPAGPTEPAAAIVTVPGGWWTSTAVVAGVWALWASVYMVRLAHAIVVVRRVRARTRPLPPDVAPRLPYWLRLSPVGRPATLVLSQGVHAAAVLGCGKPLIAVAPALVGRLDAQDLDRVVIHEWAHVQRRDDLARLAQVIVRTVAGWHPAVWWLDRRLSVEQELACDEMVVSMSGSPTAYASCLVKLASLRAARPEALLAAGALSSTGLGRRVTRLLARNESASPVWSRQAAILGVALLFVLAAGLAPVTLVEAAVSATVARALQPVTHAVATASVDDTALSPSPENARVQARTAIGSRPQAPARSRSASIATADAPVIQEADAGKKAPLPAPAGNAPFPGADPVPPPLVASALPLPATSPPVVNVDSPWRSAASAGIAIGRGSKQAGVATGNTFTRFAKKIAGSF